MVDLTKLISADERPKDYAQRGSLDDLRGDQDEDDRSLGRDLAAIAEVDWATSAAARHVEETFRFDQDPDFDPDDFDNFKAVMEEFNIPEENWNEVGLTHSQAHLRARAERVRRDLDLHQYLGEGGMGTFATRFLTNMIDPVTIPTNFIGGTALRTGGIAARTLKGGALATASVVPYELYRTGRVAGEDASDVAFTAAASFALGGLLNSLGRRYDPRMDIDKDAMRAGESAQAGVLQEADELSGLSTATLLKETLGEALEPQAAPEVRVMNAEAIADDIVAGKGEVAAAPFLEAMGVPKERIQQLSGPETKAEIQQHLDHWEVRNPNDFSELLEGLTIKEAPKPTRVKLGNRGDPEVQKAFDDEVLSLRDNTALLRPDGTEERLISGGRLQYKHQGSEVYISDVASVMERGSGRAALERFTQALDNHQLKSYLWPVPQVSKLAGKQMTPRELVDWYKQFGFEEVTSGAKTGAMVRKPRPKFTHEIEKVAQPAEPTATPRGERPRITEATPDDLYNFSRAEVLAFGSRGLEMPGRVRSIKQVQKYMRELEEEGLLDAEMRLAAERLANSPTADDVTLATGELRDDIGSNLPDSFRAEVAAAKNAEEVFEAQVHLLEELKAPQAIALVREVWQSAKEAAPEIVEVPSIQAALKERGGRLDTKKAAIRLYRALWEVKNKLDTYKFAQGERTPGLDNRPVGNAENARAIARDVLGKSAGDLEASGYLKFHDAMPPKLARKLGERGIDWSQTLAIHDLEGVTHILAFRPELKARELGGIILHEIGVHHAMPQLMGIKKFGELLVELEGLAKNSPEIQKAFDDVDAWGYKPTHRAEEALALLAETAPSNSIVTRLVSMVQSEILTRFPKLARWIGITGQTARAIAIKGLNKTARRAAKGKKPRQQYSEAERTFMEVRREGTNHKTLPVLPAPGRRALEMAAAGKKLKPADRLEAQRALQLITKHVWRTKERAFRAFLRVEASAKAEGKSSHLKGEDASVKHYKWLHDIQGEPQNVKSFAEELDDMKLAGKDAELVQQYVRFVDALENFADPADAAKAISDLSSKFLEAFPETDPGYRFALAPIPPKRKVGQPQGFDFSVKSFSAAAERALAAAGDPAHSFRVGGRFLNFDIGGKLGSSQNPLVRATSLVEDAAGKTDGDINPHAASEHKERITRRIKTKAMRVAEYAFRDWVKANDKTGIPSQFVRMRLQVRNDFFREVGLQVRNPNHSTDANVMKAADAMRTAYREALEELKDAGVHGFENIPTNPNYLPRLWSLDAIRSAETKFGTEQMVGFFGRVLQTGPQKLSDAQAMKLGKAMLMTLKRARVNSRLAAFNGSEAVAEVAEVLTQEVGHILSKKVIDDLAEILVGKPKEDAGNPSRAKFRAQIDESFAVRMETENGKAENLTLADLAESQAEDLLDVYLRSTMGRVALARKGFTSRKDWDAFIEQVRASADLIPTYTTKMLEEDVKTLEFVYRYMTGAPLHEMTGTAARFIQATKNWNFARLLNNVGFAQVAEVGRYVSIVGVRETLKTVPALRGFIKKARKGEKMSDVYQAIEDIWGFGSVGLRGKGLARFDDPFYWTAAGDAGRDSKLERFVNNYEGVTKVASNVTAQMSGLAPITDWAQLAGTKALIGKWTRLAKKGKSIFSDKRWALEGLDSNMRKRIDAELKKRGVNGVMDIDDWPDDVAEAFINTVDRITRRAVQENDIGTLATWMSHPIASIILQFRVFSITAYTKQLQAGLNVRDAQMAVEFLGSTLGGLLGYVALANAQSIGREDREEFLEKKLSVQTLGAAAIYRSSWASFLPNIADIGFQITGNEPYFASVRPSQTPTDAILGNPTADLANSLITGTGAVAGAGFSAAVGGDDEFTEAEARRLTSLLFLQNAMGIQQGLNAIISPLPDSE